MLLFHKALTYDIEIKVEILFWLPLISFFLQANNLKCYKDNDRSL